MSNALRYVGDHASGDHVSNAKVTAVAIPGFVVANVREYCIAIMAVGLHEIKFSVRPTKLSVFTSTSARVLVRVRRNVRIRRVVVTIQPERLKIRSPFGVGWLRYA